MKECYVIVRQHYDESEVLIVFLDRDRAEMHIRSLDPSGGKILESPSGPFVRVDHTTDIFIEAVPLI